VQVLQPPGWPRPKGYSNGVRVPPGHELVFVAGMVGWDETETVVSDDFVAQLEQALRNVVAVLAEAGARPEHLVRVTIFAVDVESYQSRQREVGEAWRKVMGRVFPPMALIGIRTLVEPGALVEVEATAAVPPRA